MLFPEGEALARRSLPEEAAGRGPVCALALHRAGRADLDELRIALEIFFSHSAGLAAERGKALCHTGAAAQGSHYLLFDYAHAAEAVRRLPKDERGRYRERLLDLLLAARSAEGGYLDHPMAGPAFGAGMALRAYVDLGP